MIHHIWTVFCAKMTTDRDSNNCSLLDVLEEIQLSAPTLPEGEFLIPIQSELISLWSRDPLAEPVQSIGRLQILAPDGRPVKDYHEFPIDLQNHGRMRTRIRMGGFPVRGIGQYWMVVELRDTAGAWAVVARVPFVVHHILERPQNA